MKEKLLGLEYTKLGPLHWHVKLITCGVVHSANYATLPEAIWKIIKVIVGIGSSKNVEAACGFVSDLKGES